MIRQFDVFSNPSRRGSEERPYVIVVQSSLLAEVETRVCVPLIAERFLKPTNRLNPLFDIKQRAVYLHPVEIATIPLRLLRSPIANLEEYRERIIAALDLVFTGI